MSQFYAYMWLREDGTPYYAGKGSGRRAYIRGSHHLNPPEDESQILIFSRASEAEAIATEKELIANWGRKDLGTGCLRNFTDGGDGISGYRHTEENKKTMNAGRKGKPSWNKGIPQTPEHIAKLSAVRKGKNKGVHRPPHVLAALHSPESIAKATAARVGHTTSEETKHKISQAHLGIKATEETKKRLSESHKGYRPSTEARQKLSASIKKSWILRKQQGKINTGRKHSEEAKQKMKAAAQARAAMKRVQS